MLQGKVSINLFISMQHWFYIFWPVDWIYPFSPTCLLALFTLLLLTPCGVVPMLHYVLLCKLTEDKYPLCGACSKLNGGGEGIISAHVNTARLVWHGVKWGKGVRVKVPVVPPMAFVGCGYWVRMQLWWASPGLCLSEVNSSHCRPGDFHREAADSIHCWWGLN